MQRRFTKRGDVQPNEVVAASTDSSGASPTVVGKHAPSIGARGRPIGRRRCCQPIVTEFQAAAVDVTLTAKVVVELVS